MRDDAFLLMEGISRGSRSFLLRKYTELDKIMLDDPSDSIVHNDEDCLIDSEGAFN